MGSRYMELINNLVLFININIIIFSVQDGDASQCRDDDEFTKCGLNCHPTCTKIAAKYQTGLCFLDQCYPGCYCKEGLFRNAGVALVPKSDC